MVGEGENQTHCALRAVMSGRSTSHISQRGGASASYFVWKGFPSLGFGAISPLTELAVFEEDI